MDLLGVQLFRERCKAGHIGKEDGNELALSLYGATGRQDFFGEVLRGVGFGLLIVDLKRFLGLLQVMATFAAEYVVRKDWSATLWAKTGKFFSALPAEFLVIKIFRLTFRAFHN